MHKKFLRTYTLLGLMFTSTINPGRAGEYETAFLSELEQNNATRFFCKMGRKIESKTEWNVQRKEVTIGESKTLKPGISPINAQPHDYIRTQHTQMQDVKVPTWTPASYPCSSCSRAIDVYDTQLGSIRVSWVEKGKITISIPPRCRNGQNGNLCQSLPSCPPRITSRANNEPDNNEPETTKPDHLGILCSRTSINLYTHLGWEYCLDILWKEAVAIDNEAKKDNDNSLPVLKRNIVTVGQWKKPPTCLVQ